MFCHASRTANRVHGHAKVPQVVAMGWPVDRLRGAKKPPPQMRYSLCLTRAEVMNLQSLPNLAGRTAAPTSKRQESAILHHIRSSWKS